MFSGTLSQAILETLAYSDIFDYPLRLEEIHRYLPMRASQEEVRDALPVLLNKQVGTKDDYCFLAGRDDIVGIRIQREEHSRRLFTIAIKYGRILGSLPFIRMVGLTGSLAVLNSSKDADFDYMLVTVPGRLWTARAFTLLFNRLVRGFGHTVCPNLIVAETAIEWTQHDLYSARELCQLIPITGLDVYRHLLTANRWAQEFLPNGFTESDPLSDWRSTNQTIQSVLEAPLRSRFGGRFERWEMDRKIARFSKQDGFGEETRFSTEICQGNFHHHRTWTEKALTERLMLMNGAALPEKRIEELV